MRDLLFSRLILIGQIRSKTESIKAPGQWHAGKRLFNEWKMLQRGCPWSDESCLLLWTTGCFCMSQYCPFRLLHLLLLWNASVQIVGTCKIIWSLYFSFNFTQAEMFSVQGCFLRGSLYDSALHIWSRTQCSIFVLGTYSLWSEIWLPFSFFPARV